MTEPNVFQALLDRNEESLDEVTRARVERRLFDLQSAPQARATWRPVWRLAAAAMLLSAGAVAAHAGGFGATFWKNSSVPQPAPRPVDTAAPLRPTDAPPLAREGSRDEMYADDVDKPTPARAKASAGPALHTPEAAASTRSDLEQLILADEARLSGRMSEAFSFYAPLLKSPDQQARALASLHRARISPQLGKQAEVLKELRRVVETAPEPTREDLYWEAVSISRTEQNESERMQSERAYLEAYPNGRYVARIRDRHQDAP